MGALQALEWGSAYPDRVQRVIAVIGGAEENAFLIGWLQLWVCIGMQVWLWRSFGDAKMLPTLVS